MVQPVVEGGSDSDGSIIRSMSGWGFAFVGGIVAWGAKKQPSIALSTMEAEIMAGSAAACEAVFLRGLADTADGLGTGLRRNLERSRARPAATALATAATGHRTGGSRRGRWRRADCSTDGLAQPPERKVLLVGEG